MNTYKPENAGLYWDNVYKKPEKELSWYEPVPVTSLSLLDFTGLPKDAPIIDVGGGAGTLARHLLVQGFENITVLDISARALELGRQRLGDMASGIKWVHSNILDFRPPVQYSIWHDRASFHFLIRQEEQQQYIRQAYDSLLPGSQFIIGAFSAKAPARCAGLPVQRYTEELMKESCKGLFRADKMIRRQHITPAHTLQEFIYGRFIKQ